MAIAYISEYEEVVTVGPGIGIQVPKEPSLAEQDITYTSSTPCLALNNATRFVRIICDADAFVLFNLPGVTTNATASNSKLIKANTPEYFGVTGDMLIEFYDGTT